MIRWGWFSPWRNLDVRAGELSVVERDRFDRDVYTSDAIEDFGEEVSVRVTRREPDCRDSLGIHQLTRYS